MPLDNNWSAPFNDDVAAAKGRHQQAVQDAHREWEEARARAISERDLDADAARDAWEAVKSHPDAEGYAEARCAWEASKMPANLHPARKALDAAIRKADEDYKVALVRLGAQHNVSIGIQPR